MSLVSLEAEQSVIGACLLENRLIDKIGESIGRHDFASTATSIVWATMARLRASGAAVDMVTVSEALEDDDTYAEVGGITYLAEIARNTPSASNGLSYAEIVADLSRRRRLVEDAAALDLMARDKAQPLGDTIDEGSRRLGRLVRADADEAGPIDRDLGGLLDDLDRKWHGEQDAMGLSFGLADLDKRTMGMHPGNLVILGGRPSMGKTAFALNILRAACIRDRRPAVVFSMEMDRNALRDRLTAAVCDVPLQALRDPRANMNDALWARMARIREIQGAPLVVDDRAGLTPSQIRSAAKRWRDHYGSLGLIVVDYLQLARSDSKRHGSREQEVSELSRAMKLLAKELQCPVVAVSQLNRSLEARPNKRPLMSDLRESGSLEQDADLILFLYRHEVYHPEEYITQGVAEIIIAKQREGDIGKVYTHSRLANARFENLDRQHVEKLALFEQQKRGTPKTGGMAEI